MSTATTLPSLLFYCQHSLGMGHLVRTLHLLEALRAHFRVVLLSGGRMPAAIAIPPGVEVIELPALGMDEASNLVSLDARFDVQSAVVERRMRILEAFERARHAVVMVELFPFGRKKLAGEILPLLEAARRAPHRPVVLCSLRDILVSDRRDQAAHDARAVAVVNEYFDAVLMHTDPAFAQLGESCDAMASLRKPVHYTGFVAAAMPARTACRERRHLLISAGGGAVGKVLYETALAAHVRAYRRHGLTLRIVTGPFYPEPDWQRLRQLAAGVPAVELVRALPSLVEEMNRAAGSVSQCGYNTAMDLLRTGVPALVVPFADGRENEQTVRARRLSQLGLLRVLDPRELDVESLMREMAALTGFVPAATGLDLDGARASARIARDLHRTRVAAGAPA